MQRGFTHQPYKPKSPTPVLQGWGFGVLPWSCGLIRRILFALLAHRHRSLLLVDVLEEDREGDEEGDTDQIFNALDVRVVIDQGVQGFHHAGGQHVLSRQFAELPVRLMQGADKGG